MIEVRKVTTKRQMRAFCKLPLKLYGACDQYVPDLISDEMNLFNPKHNPAFEFCEAQCFLAYRGEEIVGRIAGIISHGANDKWGTKNVRFTRIDFIEDIEVAKALLDTVEAWGRAHGMEQLHGPIGFCDLDQEGMLVEGFEYESLFFTIYNYAYYPAMLETLGFKKAVDWVEFRIAVPQETDERIERLSDMVLKRYQLTLFTPKTRRELRPMVRPVLDIINQAYDQLYGTVKLSDALLQKYYKQFILLINPRYFRAVLDEHGKPLGFGLAMPSLNQAAKRIKGRLFPFGWWHLLRAPYKRTEVLDLYLVGVLPHMVNRGLPAILLDAITQEARRQGVKVAETGPELETNLRVQAMWKSYEAHHHHRRRCYIRPIA